MGPDLATDTEQEVKQREAAINLSTVGDSPQWLIGMDPRERAFGEALMVRRMGEHIAVVHKIADVQAASTEPFTFSINGSPVTPQIQHHPGEHAPYTTHRIFTHIAEEGETTIEFSNSRFKFTISGDS